MRDGRSRFLPILALALAVCFAASSAFADATWQQVINVADGTGPDVDLTLGVDPSATTGIDAALSEVEQPPKPPAGNFDARFTGAGIGNGLLVNLQPGSTPVSQVTLTVEVQTVNAGANFTLTWDQVGLGSRVTAAQLQDNFGGVVLDVDMTAQNTVTTNVTPLKITFTTEDPLVEYDRLTVQAQPNTVTSAQPFGTALQIRAEDGAGNPATTAVAITIAKATGAGTLTGTLTANTNPATGIATFSDLTYTAVVDNETFTIQATANDLDGNPVTAATTTNITADIPPLSPPTLIPVPAAVADTQENQTPLLQWTAGTGAQSYELDLGVSPACESVANDVAVAGLSWQAPRLADGSYCWRVRSIGTGGTQSAWSADSTFDTIPTFGEWGLIFLIASMVGCGGWYLRRRVGANS